jgi:hypothetical protein
MVDDAEPVTVNCEISTFAGSSMLDDDSLDDFATATYVTNSYISVSLGTSDDGGGSFSPNTCFAGSEAVMLADGTTKAISDVVLGDSILSSDGSGNVKFSNVIAVPHDRNHELATFIQLSAASADIKMTADHLVMVDPACDGVATLKAASAVESGMCLVSVHGSITIESVKMVQGRGVYSVVTEEEFIVVNGFVASPFAVSHAVANAYYNVIRAVPALLQFDVVRQASALLGSLALSVST